jgi:hypothetical protein
MRSSFRASLFALLFAIGIAGYTQPAPAMGSPLWQLAKVKGQLNLNTSQQAQWDNAAALARTAHETARANFSQLNTAMQAELAKPEPDLASMATAADGVQAQNETSRKTARAAWLALYATFSPEQKAVVAGALKAGMERERAHRMQRGAPPATN